MFQKTEALELEGFAFEIRNLTLDELAEWLGKDGIVPAVANRAILARSVWFDGAPLGDRVGELTLSLMNKLLPHVLKINGLEAPDSPPALRVVASGPAPPASDVGGIAGPKH